MHSDAQVEAAARVLWEGDSHLHRPVDWDTASDDARRPYRRMAAKMLDAAAEAAP